MEAIEATGINKIVWIDDDFADSSIDEASIISLILDHSEAFLDAGNLDELRNLYSQADFDFESPKVLLLEEISQYLRSLDSLGLRKISESVEGEGTEFSDSDIEALSECIGNTGIKLSKHSLREWKEVSEKYNGARSETLFLIDKDFDKEGEESDAGTKLLKDLIEQYGSDQPPNFILFTHTCRGPNDEEQLRRSIYTGINEGREHNIESFNFQVLSKSVAYDKESAEPRIINCIRAIFVRKIFSKMAYGLRDEIVRRIDEVTERLISTNVYGLDKSIFGSSLKEGVSELELLHRIYSLSQKTAITKMIQKNKSVVEELTKLRTLKGQMGVGFKDSEFDLTDFRDLRKEEFWLDGVDINKTHSPIACGDIFKLKKREFILLTQACDTILREDGKRKTNIAVLAPIKKYDFNDQESYDKKYKECGSEVFSFVFKESCIEKSFWRIKFNEAVPISLDVLDLCTFNDEGRVAYSKNQALPPLLHLEGQRSKFGRFSQLSEEEKDFPVNICMDVGIVKMHHEFEPLLFKEDEGWFSDLRRVKRLDVMYSEHVLNEYFTYRSRKAFDHDYTGS
tara:strand:- start:20265 stop:21968 length:1704 start_codon:yes stop_codon:yes gene_type:complete